MRWTRRALLQLGAAVACLGPTGARAQRRGRPPERLRPQPGDGLVYAFGEQQGKKLLAEHVVRDVAPLLAYPVESSSGLVRDGSRLNQVLVIRLDPDVLSAKTASRAADGIVAYSAVCTHTGCDVSGWQGETLRFVCPCHGSEFEAVDAALVVSGPAPKPPPGPRTTRSDGKANVRTRKTLLNSLSLRGLPVASAMEQPRLAALAISLSGQRQV